MGNILEPSKHLEIVEAWSNRNPMDRALDKLRNRIFKILPTALRRMENEEIEALSNSNPSLNNFYGCNKLDDIFNDTFYNELKKYTDKRKNSFGKNRRRGAGINAYKRKSVYKRRHSRRSHKRR